MTHEIRRPISRPAKSLSAIHGWFQGVLKNALELYQKRDIPWALNWQLQQLDGDLEALIRATRLPVRGEIGVNRAVRFY